MESVRPDTARRGRQRGFTMALLLAMIVVMIILTTAAVPKASAMVQRENEAELIFRGEAIANALRIYKARTGAYPNNLDDLLKVRPRILRKAYKDPMTREGDWDFVYQVQPGATGDTTGLPIVGVRSKSLADSIKIYENKTMVHDWIFSADANILGLPGSDGTKGGQGGAPDGKGANPGGDNGKGGNPGGDPAPKD